MSAQTNAGPRAAVRWPGFCAAGAGAVTGRPAGQGRPHRLRGLPPDLGALLLLRRPSASLCARCSGQYLGALFGLVLLLVLGRGRAGALPPTGIVLLLLGFLAVWAFDGLNSYLTFFPGLPHLYEPRNILRVTTGAMQGWP
ncbi:MAG: DUF2085 domain-containing protein [Caldilineales bacterium]